LGMCLPKDFMPSDFEALENQCFYLHSAAIWSALVPLALQAPSNHQERWRHDVLPGSCHLSCSASSTHRRGGSSGVGSSGVWSNRGAQGLQVALPRQGSKMVQVFSTKGRCQEDGKPKPTETSDIYLLHGPP
jgi:hypothetical protein